MADNHYGNISDTKLQKYVDQNLVESWQILLNIPNVYCSLEGYRNKLGKLEASEATVKF